MPSTASVGVREGRTQIPRRFGWSATLTYCLAGLLAATPNPARAQLDSILQGLTGAARALNQPPPPPNPYQQGYPPPGYARPPAYYPPAYAQPGYPPSRYPQPIVRPAARAPEPERADAQAVADLQRMLSELGYDAGAADGAIGSRTIQAVREFQRDHGQAPTGEVSPTTIAAVRGAWFGRAQSPTQRPSALPTAVAGASFDCRRASSPTERSICQHPDLAGLDAEVAETYEAARAGLSAPEAASLAATQRLWLQSRDACGADRSCLQSSLADRVAELGGASPSGPTAGAAPTDAAATTSDNPLVALQRPAAGLRPWHFETFEGRPALSYLNKRPPGVGASGDDANRRDMEIAGDFFRLLAIGRTPGAFEAAGQRQFLADLLAPEVRKTLFNPQLQFAGANELEQQRTERRGYDTYVPRIKSMVPEAPFALPWIEMASLGPYDAAREGFPVKTSSSNVAISMLRALNYTVGQLKLAEMLSSAKLTPVGLPDDELFWPINRAKAEAILREVPDRAVELVADVTVASIDRSANEAVVQISRLGLYAPGEKTKLFEFAITPVAVAAAPSASAPASFDDAAARNGRDAAKRYGLPTVGGLPAIGPQQMSGGGVDQTSWPKVQTLITLANTPDIASTMSEYLAAKLACDLLPLPVQTQLFKRNSCELVRYSRGSQVGAEFALKDGAALFKQRELTKLIDAAPKLPLRVMAVVETHLNDFDTVRSGFPLDSKGRISILGSPIDVELPSFWPLAEKDARAYLARVPDRNYVRAWLGISGAITGVVPGPAPSDQNQALAFPHNARLTFHTDEIALYSDAALHRALYRFPTDAARVAPVILGSEAEQAPRPAGPMPLGGEAALLALERQGLPPGLAIRWDEAAALRFSVDQKIRNRTDWAQFDPWGAFFSQSPTPDTVERYKQWTARRAAAMPEQFTLTRTMNPQNPGGAIPQIPLLDHSPAFGAFNDGDISFTPPSGEVARQLEMHDIAVSQMIQQQFRFPGSNAPVYAAVPGPLASYSMSPGGTWPSGPAAGSPQKQVQPVLRVEATLSGVEVIKPTTSYGSPLVVLRVLPRRSELLVGERVVASAPVTGPEWPAPPQRQRPAAERLAGKPYGPDMIGLRLGMKMTDAEALVRRQLNAPKELHSRTENTRSSSLSPHERALRGWLFIDEATGESIALFDSPAKAPGRLVSAWRSLPIERNAWNEILEKSLVPKYGRPVSSKDRMALWTERLIAEPVTGDCESGVGDYRSNWLTSDGQPVALSNMAGEAPSLPSAGPKDTYDGCGATLRIRSPLLMTDKPTVPLETQLYDLGVLSLLMRPDAPAADPSASARPSTSAIKF